MRRLSQLLVVGGLLVLSQAASAGVVLTVQTKGAHPEAKPNTGTMSISGKKVRIEQPGPMGKNMVMVFRADKNEMHQFDETNKIDQVVDQASVKAMAQQLDQMEKMIEAQIQSAPPQQQKAMREMMAQQKKMREKPTAKTTVHPSSEKRTLLGKTCKRFDIKKDGKLVRTMYVAPKGSFAGEKEAMVGLEAISTMMAQLTKDLPGSQQELPFGQLQKMGGVPLLIVEFNDDKEVARQTITAVTQQKLSASTFEAPAGFKRQTLIESMQQMQHRGAHGMGGAGMGAPVSRRR